MGKCVEAGKIQQGSWYWVRDRKKNFTGDSQGLVVMVAWMFSSRRYHMPYVHLFNECGWECLVCQPHYLNMWFPNRALAIAVRILDELAEELNRNPRPVTFASFSGGTKACTYMIIQILQGKAPEGFTGDMEKYKIVRECTAGYLFDSTPVNFVSEIGVLFARRMLGRTVGNNVAVKFSLRQTANALVSLFGSNFDLQAAELSSAFFAAVEMAPTLFLCSRNDSLAPFDKVEAFCSEVLSSPRSKKLTFVHWEVSDHVAHLRHHPEDYKRAVSKFLSEMSEPDQGLKFLELPDKVDEKDSTIVRLKDVAGMVVDDVFELQHDGFTTKRVALKFPQMRSRL